MRNEKRVVITGVGLTAPNGNNLEEYRAAILAGKSGIGRFETRYMGEVYAGECDYETTRYQRKKEVRRGTRAGSISIYCAHEAFNDAGIDISTRDRSRIGVYIGITEHGNVETENEIYNISQYDYDTSYWTHHHNPRTVANNPAGEVTINMNITGPHYCMGGACAAGNLGIIQGYQMLQLGDVDLALGGGVSESIHTFGIFASFRNQGALAEHPDPEKASRPFDKDRNGIVVSEGGCLYVLETLEAAKKRGAKIYGEIAGYASNSDASDFVLPDSGQQAVCMRLALERAEMKPEDVDLINCHATSTSVGDAEEINAIKSVFGENSGVYINATKGFIGHTMGAAGALELAANLPSFEDGLIHPCMNVENLDPECYHPNLVLDKPKEADKIDVIFNSSFGMLGINSSIIIKRYKE